MVHVPFTAEHPDLTLNAEGLMSSWVFCSGILIVMFEGGFFLLGFVVFFQQTSMNLSSPLPAEELR